MHALALPGALSRVHGPDWPHRSAGAAQWLDSPGRLELLLAIEAWPELLGPVVAAFDELATGPDGPALAEIRLRPPVHAPQKIVAVGLNYPSHAAEAERDTSEFPVLFDNVLLTGHTGARGSRSQERLRRTCAQQVIDYLSGKVPAHVVNREERS